MVFNASKEHEIAGAGKGWTLTPISLKATAKHNSITTDEYEATNLQVNEHKKLTKRQLTTVTLKQSASEITLMWRAKENQKVH